MKSIRHFLALTFVVPWMVSTMTHSAFAAPEIAVFGNGVNIADGDATPSAADHTDFGNVNVSNTLTRTFTITNSGNTALAVGGITVGGPNAAEFTVVLAPASSVAASNKTTFQIRFKPTSLGLRSATLSFTNDDSDENPFNFSIQGTGVASGGAAPEIGVSADGIDIYDGALYNELPNLDFGPVLFTNPDYSFQRVYIITNSGTGDLTIQGVATLGGNTGDFTIIVTPASIIPPGGSSSFIVKFRPLAVGARSTGIVIANNDANENPFNFDIKGRGVIPDIGLSGNGVNIVDGDTTPSVIDGTDFGDVVLTGGTLTRTFVITNYEEGSLELYGRTITGTNAADFTITDTLFNTIPGYGGKTFQVTFNPSGLGLRSARITISNNDLGQGSFDFSIQGTGVNTPPTVANAIPDQGATEDITFNFTFASNAFTDPDPGSVLTYTATNVPAWLTFTPAARAFSGTPGDEDVGFVDITVIAADNGTPTATTVSDVFRITVTNVNDVPVFAKGADQSHPAGTTGLQTVEGWATGISDGDAKVVQALTFTATNNNAELFAVPPGLVSNGTLTYTLTGISGVATVGVSLTDDATAGGAALTSPVQTFTITVEAPVAPDAPLISPDSLVMPGNGSFQFRFNNTNDAVFSVIATTNLSLPASNWTVLGSATNMGDSVYQFTDTNAASVPMRFYQLRWP